MPDLPSRQGDALIVVPPFAGLERAAFGPHLLQACARAAGFRVAIFYANQSLATEIGDRLYSELCQSPLRHLLGERLFAPFAYESSSRHSFGHHGRRRWRSLRPAIGAAEARRLEQRAGEWLDRVATSIAAADFPVVGCSSSFQQTAASVALLTRIRRLRPDTITLMGGSNCEGQMAEGILSLGGAVDFVFSGESESSFPAFLDDVRAGRRPATRVIDGRPCLHLDDIPTPDFSDYYAQLDAFLATAQAITASDVWLPYETSRGCWWGQKHHCTFCGLNGKGMTFRAKSPDRVVDELTQLVARHPSNRVTLVDNIMPHGYFRDLLPRLATELPALHMFSEQKANLTLAHVVALKKAGFAVIQPGIEALSSSLLKRMDKGQSARQSIALLRYARAADVSVTWNLLSEVPGDRLDEYEETLELLPLLRHLHPPSALCPVMIDRFSPYFDRPETYGVRNLRPWKAYADILPATAAVDSVAYHFDGDYASAAREHPALMQTIAREVEAWRTRWEVDEAPPALVVIPITDEQFVLHDTRGIDGTRELQFLTREHARAVVAGSCEPAVIAWALSRQLLARVDGQLVPLATAGPELIEEFEVEARRVRSVDRVGHSDGRP